MAAITLKRTQYDDARQPRARWIAAWRTWLRRRDAHALERQLTRRPMHDVVYDHMTATNIRLHL